jgi:hypothetical protein
LTGAGAHIDQQAYKRRIQLNTATMIGMSERSGAVPPAIVLLSLIGSWSVVIPVVEYVQTYGTGL